MTAISLKPRSESSKQVYKQFMIQQLKWESLISQGPSKFEFQEISLVKSQELNLGTFRLPNNTIPLHYSLRFTTNVHSADFVFEGVTSIIFRVLEPTKTISLHAALSRLTIERINLFTVQGSVVQSNLIFIAKSDREFLEIFVDQELQVGQEFELYIESSGVLRTDRLGFYRTSYTNRETDQINWVASTLFEPTQARSAFPCYDEIRFRTTFDITIDHHRSYNALSNMPVETVDTFENFVTTRFQRTPTMPTYNVAFTISNFDYISNKNEKLPMRVFAQPDHIAAGRANGSLELSEKMWTELRNIFEVPYPLPKCDIMAVNNWRNGEAWGLLKIDGWSLLGGEDLVADRSRRIQIAHELSVSVLSCLFDFLTIKFKIIPLTMTFSPFISTHTSATSFHRQVGVIFGMI